MKSDGTSDPIVADDTQGTSGKATPFLDETIDGDNVNGDPITVGDSSIARDSLVMRGDIALAEGKDVNISKEDEPSKYNTTDNKPVEINKNEKYALRADLDVSAVGNAMYALEKFAEESLHISAFSDIYVTNFKTGFRAVYELSDNIDGSFFVSKFDHDQEEERTKELKEHYKLIATSKDENGDPEPLLYAINYARSEFTEKKVSILMDLILDNVTEKVTAYNGGSDGTKVWGKNGVQEDFNHSGDDHGTTYNTSVYGNMKNMVLESAKKMAILIDDITIKDVEGKPDPTDNLTKGTINGTIVGYMSASIGHGAADIEFKWGAMQDDNKGKDIAIKSQPENHKIQLTIAKKTPGKEDSTDDSNDGGTDNPGDNPGGSDSNKDTKKTDADTEKEDTKKTSEESSKKTESEGIVSVTSAPVAPQTGDNAPIGAYAALMMGAMAAAGALYLKRKED